MDLRDLIAKSGVDVLTMYTPGETANLCAHYQPRRCCAICLVAAIKTHHSQKADDRCIEDDDELYEAADLPKCDRKVGDKFEMLKNCARFIDQRCEGGQWLSYRELEAKIAQLSTDLAKAQDTNRMLAERCANQSEVLSKVAEKKADTEQPPKSFLYGVEENTTPLDRVPIGSRWFHYKHPDVCYEVVGHCIIEKTSELGVLYRRLDSILVPWCRPVREWLASVGVESVIEQPAPLRAATVKKWVPRFSRVVI